MASDFSVAAVAHAFSSSHENLIRLGKPCVPGLSIVGKKVWERFLKRLGGLYESGLLNLCGDHPLQKEVDHHPQMIYIQKHFEL